MLNDLKLIHAELLDGSVVNATKMVDILVARMEARTDFSKAPYCDLFVVFHDGTAGVLSPTGHLQEYQDTDTGMYWNASNALDCAEVKRWEPVANMAAYVPVWRTDFSKAPNGRTLLVQSSLDASYEVLRWCDALRTWRDVQGFEWRSDEPGDVVLIQRYMEIPE